jgi:LDH2 family malate/lactate/ureidoglycolate dehydrogenase
MMKSRALRPGFTEILIPGEQEARRAARKSLAGVPLEDGVLSDLIALKRELGITEDIAVVGPWTDMQL